MENEIQVKPMVAPPIENVKVNKTELVYDLPTGDEYIITLPVWGYANYYVNWGDGTHTDTFMTTTVNSSNFPSKTLAGGRKYTIKVWGKIWRYGNFGVLSNEYLIEVKKIGPLDLTYAFHRASNLVKVPKKLSCGVYDLSFMFQDCSTFNYPINTWDVSSVTSMILMFRDTTNFNKPLDKWDVSSVTNMTGMFWGATNFNQPLDKWDVSNVTNMAVAFKNATNFNQPLDKWDVSNVSNMGGMFWGATSFNQPLDKWDVSSVTNMSEMFIDATNFNQPLDRWDVSIVSGMYKMFKNATSFNQPLNIWDISNVLDIRYMFNGTTSFNQPLNNWILSTSNINLSYMFSGATSFNQPLNNWNVSNVIIMNSMFENATSFNQPLNNWNVSNVINMSSMFKNAISFNQPLHDWNWTNISSANMTSMLDYCGMSQYNFQLTLVGWYNIFSPLPIPDTSKHFGAKGLVYNPARIIVDLVEETPVYANDNPWFVADNAIAVNFDL
jgi:surface protein